MTPGGVSAAAAAPPAGRRRSPGHLAGVGPRPLFMHLDQQPPWPTLASTSYLLPRAAVLDHVGASLGYREQEIGDPVVVGPQARSVSPSTGA